MLWDFLNICNREVELLLSICNSGLIKWSINMGEIEAIYYALFTSKLLSLMLNVFLSRYVSV